uniref:Sulfatase n=2 Tax=Haloterrigena alkaliphila TaxID=2816475 RepID=A0A8A2VKG0_9EURY
MFSERVDLKGELESRISLGSTSEEFLERNFGDDTFHDTVYVNTNPYLPRLDLDDGTFHAVVDLLNEWDSELQTVHPETVCNAAHKAHEEFPNKRLIIHFMQPHYPFIGETGKQIEARGWTTDDVTINGTSIWGHLRNDTTNVDLETVWEAYLENLDIVVEHVRTLLDTVIGKTVITADHGNLVGERLSPIPTRKKYGHPYGVYTPELVKVPWLVIPSDTRRKIESSLPIDQQTKSDEMIEDRLRALGYR